MVVCNSMLDRDSRVRSAPLEVGRSQVVATGHKDVKLPQLLDVVDGELDASLHLQVPVVTVVQSHHTSAHLPGLVRVTGRRTRDIKQESTYKIELLVKD